MPGESTGVAAFGAAGCVEIESVACARSTSRTVTGFAFAITMVVSSGANRS